MFGLFGKRPTHPKNDAVRRALANHGDTGAKPRHVIHFAYPFQTGAPADKTTAKATVSGIAVVDFTETADAAGIVFEHRREVASQEFDDLTDRLETALAAIEWEYDGWECAVETD